MEIVSFVFILAALSSVSGKICPGYCVPSELCTGHEGKVVGYCVNGRACCDVRNTTAYVNQSCGKEAVWEGGKAVFTSPDYPGYSSGSVICPFDIKLDLETVGIELELIKFELDDGKEAISGTGGGIKCDSDMFFIKGFSDWMTDAKCGKLNGYSVLMDIDKGELAEKKVVLLFITSSKEFRWKIRIHQISSHKVQKSETCIKSRFENWKSSKEYPQNFPKLGSMPFGTGLMSGGDTQRWKWEVDIVSMTNDLSKCARNDSLPLPWHRMCKGTIIDDRHILTSASCFLHQPKIQDLRVATSAFCPVEPRTLRDQLYDILSVTVHYNHQPNFIMNDIAVIRTKRGIGFGESVQPLGPFERFPSAVYTHSLRKEPSTGAVGAVTLMQEPAKACFDSLAMALGLSEKSVADLRKSHKYSTVLDGLLCGPINSNLTDTEESCFHEEIHSLGGYPLVSLNRSNGDPILGGFFSTAFKSYDEHHPHHHHHHYLPTAAIKSDTATSSYRSYFTLLGSFHKWILMAIA